MKAYHTKNKAIIKRAISTDDNPESLIALELVSLNYREAIRIAKLLIKLVKTDKS